jgi:hypothetical protein
VYVGDFEARATPVADTDPATGLAASARFTPGTYRMLYVSPDHGFRRFTFTVGAGAADQTVAIDDTDVNLASAAAGASVIGSTAGSLNPELLIDGTEGTNWGGVTAENVDVSTPSVAVDLAGDVHTVRRVQVSALLTPAPADPNALPLAADPDSGSRFTALRKFALQSCVAACATDGATWTTFFTSADDAFPGTVPRPVAPDQNMRSFDVPATQAAAVRLVALENQCTGNAEYAGEQDNDLNNATDCATASDRGTIVHASELQVFEQPAAPGGVLPTPGTTTTPKATKTRLAVSKKRVVKGQRGALYASVVRGGTSIGKAGKLVVIRDGKRRGTVSLSRGRTTIRLAKTLSVGTHRFRVKFVPRNPKAYRGSTSKVVTIKVVRRR